MVDSVLMDILNNFINFEQVESIAIGGSTAGSTNDSLSDIDVYIFVNSDIPIKNREKIIEKYSSNFEAGGEYFGSGDEFYADSLKRQIDAMYWDVNWFENTVKNVWVKHYPSNGYTTAFLYTLKNFEIIYDKKDRLKNLKETVNSEYPQQLQQNIIKRNIMLLKDKPFASYYEQIEKALKRNDTISVNHRIAAFIASYFDIIFAVNKILHPGEKRLIKYAKDNCGILPLNFEENLNKLMIQPNQNTLNILNNIIDELRKIMPEQY